MQTKHIFPKITTAKTFLGILLFFICIYILIHILHLFENIPATKPKLTQDTLTTTQETPIKTYTVLLDPGHGGSDPGKIGIDKNVLEKNINLIIANKCKDLLESETAANYNVLLTREEDCMLCDETSTCKKSADMKRRREIIENSNADVAISIHQNSYPSPNVFGAQVFYYNQSTNGENLAKSIQAELLSCNQNNKRQIKANDTYYILKSGTCPVVICECGFLSNPEECKKLSTPEYQLAIATAIVKGIISYLKSCNA